MEAKEQLPDGRVISVGGEHKDFCDPHFYIENLVAVFDQGEIRMYGYPTAVFSPTDCHTATLVGGQPAVAIARLQLGYAEG
jgi:hypothetical protein